MVVVQDNHPCANDQQQEQQQQQSPHDSLEQQPMAATATIVREEEDEEDPHLLELQRHHKEQEGLVDALDAENKHCRASSQVLLWQVMTMKDVNDRLARVLETTRDYNVEFQQVHLPAARQEHETWLAEAAMSRTRTASASPRPTPGHGAGVTGTNRSQSLRRDGRANHPSCPRTSLGSSSPGGH